MFGKSKKKKALIQQANVVDLNYSSWEKDLGFLDLIMKQKIEIAKQYDILLFAQMLKEKTDYIKQDDIQEIYTETSRQIYESIGDAYKNYLVKKYFGEDKQLLIYIEENVLHSFITTAIELNNNKMRQEEAAATKELINLLNSKEKIK